MTSGGHPLFGSIIAVIGALAYGINIPAARVAGLAGVNGSNLGMQRGLVLITILLLLCLVTRRSLRMSEGQSGKIISAGLCAGLTAVGYLSALSFIPVGIAVTIFYLFPLFLILFSAASGKGPISIHKMLAFVIAFAGIVLCVGPGLEQLDWRGLALAFGAAFSCALLFMLTASIKQESISLIFWIQFFALGLIIPVAWATGFSPVSAISNSWLAIIISAIGFYIGFACQVIAGSKVHPATLGLIFLIEPVVAIITAATFLGEQMLPVQYAGVALVLSGLAYDIWRQNSGQQSTGESKAV